MSFVLYAVAAIYAASIVFVVALLGSTLWHERRAARSTAPVSPIAPAATDGELSELSELPELAELSGEGHRTSVA